jgi:uncharacterized SAM-binding protein YcdF (DUF218 family)
LLALFVKKKKLKRIFTISLIAVLWFFSNSFIFDQVVRFWEVKPVQLSELDTTYEYGIVLGGIASFDEDYQRTVFTGSTDRIMQTLYLYKSGIIKKIVIVGGSYRVLLKDRKEAEYLKEYLVLLGIPEEDILTETESRNTHENAANAAVLLKDQLNNKMLLVTSAFHIRRAKGCFEKEGFTVDVFPAQQMSSIGPFNPASLIVPRAGVFGGWNLMLKEILGYVTYKVTGYL